MLLPLCMAFLLGWEFPLAKIVSKFDQNQQGQTPKTFSVRILRSTTNKRGEERASEKRRNDERTAVYASAVSEKNRYKVRWSIFQDGENRGLGNL